MQVSIVIPTYNEEKNISIIIPQIFAILKQANITSEVIVVDDNSQDQTAQEVKQLMKSYPVRLIERSERGLASAVIAGFNAANGQIYIVMDADGSHPVDKLPDMINPILKGEADVTVGTRYIEGATTENWSLFRRYLSKSSGFLAKQVVDISDPTTGFMGIRADLYKQYTYKPSGWKVVLEILAKIPIKKIKEVPIVFRDRVYGKSKLSFPVILENIKHGISLLSFKRPMLLASLIVLASVITIFLLYLFVILFHLL